jgi:signal transduction histidine kinase
MSLALTPKNEDPRDPSVSPWSPSGLPVDDDYENLLLLASQISGMAIAAVTEIRDGYAFFQAQLGLDIGQIPWSFPKEEETGEAILIPDTLADAVMSKHPMVTAAPHIRSFSAFPLYIDKGKLSGHLCVMSKVSGCLSDCQITAMKTLAVHVAGLIKLKGQLSEMTDRNMVAEQLDKHKAFYERILNKLPTDIAVFDAEHRYLFVNPGAISNEEFRKFIIGKDDYQYVAFRNRDISVAHSRRAKFLEVKNTGKEIRWEESMETPNGNVIHNLRRMYPVYDDNGQLQLVIGFGMDITDRKGMEEKQAALVKQLSAQNTQLIDFCSIVSHNLRAPLVNMSMLVDFIQATADTEEQKLLISKLRPVCDNLSATFNELVESIQIKQDLEVKSETICLKDCIQRTLDGLQMEINKLGAHFEIDIDEVPAISYPPKYLNSIIHNLVSNSLKYHYPGREPLITIRTSRNGDNVILSIKDNGLGIDLVKHRENFFKIGKVFHRHPNAKGFGLFMTKTHVDAMGGKIWVESKPDEGSVFYIEFVNRKKQAL